MDSAQYYRLRTSGICVTCCVGTAASGYSQCPKCRVRQRFPIKRPTAAQLAQFPEVVRLIATMLMSGKSIRNITDLTRHGREHVLWAVHEVETALKLRIPRKVHGHSVRCDCEACYEPEDDKWLRGPQCQKCGLHGEHECLSSVNFASRGWEANYER